MKNNSYIEEDGCMYYVIISGQLVASYFKRLDAETSFEKLNRIWSRDDHKIIN